MTEGASAMDEPAAALFAAQAVTYAVPMSESLDDSALMLRYKDGDVAAFETLYRRHKDAVFRYLLRRCGRRDAAEDVFQDMWGKLINARTTYRPTAKFTTFLYHIAHNCFIDYLRRNNRHAKAVDVATDLIAHPGEHLEAVTEKSLARRRLQVALLTLPDEQRDVFLLHQESGLSLDQIATVTNCNRETVKSRLRYATNKLRSALDSAR